MEQRFSALPKNVQREISALIFLGNKIGAIKRYREAVDCELKTAKEAIEEVTDQLKISDPSQFQVGQQRGGKGIAAFFAVLVIGAIVSVKLSAENKEALQEKFDTLLREGKQKLGFAEPVPKVTKRRPIDHETPYQPVAPKDANTDLESLYRLKLANPDYLAWKNEPGLPWGYQDFMEEHHIKYVRAEITRNLALPEDAVMLTIPVVPASRIAIDGAIQHQEWLRAARVPLEPAETGSLLYMQADEEWLYLAMDVPRDTTRSGYDQFRFFIHVDIDPAIKNERIHVSGGRSEALGGIRETRLTWQGEPPTRKEDSWKRYPISDARIYRLAQGASSMEQHRQFEAKLNLKESGLTAGRPFPAFVEVETDPVEEGGSRKRRYLGGLGDQNRPVWLTMQPAEQSLR